MRLRFNDPALAGICNRRAAVDNKWGQAIGARLRRRLCLLAGVPNLELLAHVPGVLESPMRVDGKGRFQIGVGPSVYILAKPDQDPIPYLGTGKLACADVKQLMIIEVIVDGYSALK
jgi:hypothetical protein